VVPGDITLCSRIGTDLSTPSHSDCDTGVLFQEHHQCFFCVMDFKTIDLQVEAIDNPLATASHTLFV
jgi:hypothetical protein